MIVIITFASLFGMMLLELWKPRRDIKLLAWRKLGNFSLWIFSATAISLIFTIPTQPVWLDHYYINFIWSFLLLDLTSYVIHRFFHAVPFLWQFHSVHHSDAHIDVTTAIRVNPIEGLLSALVYSVVIIIFRIPTIVIVANFMTAFVLAVVTHANISLPYWLERALRPVLITLDLHLIHHSNNMSEAETNFGSIFSFWDRLFGTLHAIEREEIDKLNFGLCNERAAGYDFITKEFNQDVRIANAVFDPIEEIRKHQIWIK